MHKATVTILPFCIMIAVCIGCSSSSSETPGRLYSTAYVYGEWEIGLPEELGLDLTAAERALNDIIGDRNTLSFLVVKDGFLVYEYYADGHDQESLFDTASVTKSLVSALVGIAIDNGYILGADTKLIEFMHGLNEDNKEITIEHLLTMTDGWHWPELPPLISGSDRSRMLFPEIPTDIHEIYLATNNLVRLNPPGTVFNYNSYSTNLLSAVIQIATGMFTEYFAYEYLFSVIGITSYRWPRWPYSYFAAGDNVSMTSRNLARFGQLYLNNGRWGETQVITEQWVIDSTQRQSAGFPAISPHGYGYQWWIDQIDGHHMFFAMGMGGQHVFVIPDLSIVAVVTRQLTPATTNNSSIIPLQSFKNFIRSAVLTE